MIFLHYYSYVCVHIHIYTHICIYIHIHNEIPLRDKKKQAPDKENKIDEA